MDPRLVQAVPGQFLYGDMFGFLTVGEDQHYRQQNRLLNESRRRDAGASWREQLQQAAMTTLPEGMSHYVPRTSQQPVPPIQSQAPSYVQNLSNQVPRTGQQTVPPIQFQAASPYVYNPGHRPHRHQPYPPPQQQVRVPPTQARAPGPIRRGPIHNSPAAPIAAAASTPVLPTINPNVHAAEFAENVEERQRAFETLSKTEKATVLLSLLTAQGNHDPRGRARARPTGLHRQQNSLAQRPLPVPGPLRVSAQAAARQPLPVPGNQQQVAGFVNHPGFSNVTSSFPNVQQNRGGNTHTR